MTNPIPIVAPGLNVIGAGEPSLPGIAIGHNERIAFGITVFSIAQEDLYVYDTHPRNPSEYRYRDGWEPMKILREVIAVAGEPAVDAELKFTRHGPVVWEDPDRHRAYAVRAAWLDTGGAPYLASMRYLRAKNMKEFAQALKYWGSPGENQMYADTAGQIGWFPAGFTPVRPNSDGLLPLPGDGRYEWHGYVDRELLPSEINPARGYIATANQMNLPRDYPYAQRRVSFDWIDDEFRFKRISEVLDGLPKSSVKDSTELQNDALSLPARRLMTVLGALVAPDPQLQEVAHWLSAWDGKVAAESPQAALFEVWISRHLLTAVMARITPALSERVRASAKAKLSAAVVDLIEHPDRRLGSDPKKVRDELMLQTLNEALRETQQLLGTDRSRWAWGKLATVFLEHPLAPLAGEALRLKMNVGPAGKAGDASVVGLASYRPQDFRTQGGASFRMVLDVGQWDESLVVNTPGQSGDPSSPHYRDLFPLWIDGKYFPLLYSRGAVEMAAEQRIVLGQR